MVISPIDTSSLLGTFPGGAGTTTAPAASGFGPAAVLSLGSKGVDPLAAMTSGLQQMLLQQSAAATAPKPLLSQQQVDAFNARVQDAASALDAGRLQDAREHAQALLRDDYNNPIAYHLLGRIESESGELDAAIRFYDRAAELAPDSERFADDAFVARQLKQGGNVVMESAANLVKRPDSAARGIRLLFEMGRRGDRDGEVFMNIARGFETLGMPVQQLGAFDTVVLEGTTSDLQLLEDELTRFIEEHEPVGLAFSLLGRTQQRLGKFDEAMQSLEQARQIAPETSQYTTELANVYASSANEALAEGDLASAKHRFTVAHELDLADRDIALGLAAVHVSIAHRNLEFGLDNDARNNLRRAVTLMQDDGALDLEIGRAYMRLGARAEAKEQHALALHDLEAAYEHGPELQGLDRQLADAHRAAAQRLVEDNPGGDLSTSEHESIVAHHQAAFDLFSGRTSYRQDLAAALNDFGLKLMNENEDYARAVDMFKQARDLEPDDPTYLANWQQAWQLNDTD